MMQKITVLISFLLFSFSSFSGKIIEGEYSFFREPKQLRIYLDDQKICIEQDFNKVIFDFSTEMVIIVSDKIKSYSMFKFDDFNQQISEAAKISFGQLLSSVSDDKRDSLSSLYNFSHFSDAFITPVMPKFSFERSHEKSPIASQNAYRVVVKNGKTKLETLSFAVDTLGKGFIPNFQIFKMLQLFLPELSFDHQLSVDYQNLMVGGIPLSINSKNFNWQVSSVLDEKIENSVFSFSDSYNAIDAISLMSFLVEDRYRSLLN